MSHSCCSRTSEKFSNWPEVNRKREQNYPLLSSIKEIRFYFFPIFSHFSFDFFVSKESSGSANFICLTSQILSISLMLSIFFLVLYFVIGGNVNHNAAAGAPWTLSFYHHHYHYHHHNGPPSPPSPPKPARFNRADLPSTWLKVIKIVYEHPLF